MLEDNFSNFKNEWRYFWIYKSRN